MTQPDCLDSSIEGVNMDKAGYVGVLVFLVSCFHPESDPSGRSLRSESEDGGGGMVRSHPSQIRHEQVPCRDAKDKFPGTGPRARHVELGISKELPPTANQDVGMYTRYQDCDDQ